MAVNTSNAYGKITITNEAIALVAGYIARDCYGVVDLVSRSFSDSFSEFLKKKPMAKGVRLVTADNRITVDLYVILRYGCNIRAVSESLKKSIKYGLEEFTGMIIDAINVHVVGVRV